MTIHQVEQCSYDVFLALRRDAYIYRLEQSAAGQAYLDNAWRMEQTKPDRIALRKEVGGENHAKQ